MFIGLLLFSKKVSLEEGQPHERKFVITCSVGKQSEQGTGKSKKLAKRRAAHLMLELLKSQPAEFGGAFGGGGGRGGALSAEADYGLGDLDEDELVLAIAAR